MKLALTLAILLTLLRLEASAQPIARGPFWSRIPTVIVVAATADDPRVPLVRDAVDFWNHTFAEIGSPFRLGPVVIARGEMPVGDLQLLHQTIVDNGYNGVLLPASVAPKPGDLIRGPVGWRFHIVLRPLCFRQQGARRDQDHAWLPDDLSQCRTQCDRARNRPRCRPQPQQRPGDADVRPPSVLPP